MSKINAAPEHGYTIRGKFMTTVAGTIIAASFAAGAASADPYATVSSSGQAYTVSQGMMFTESEPFAGYGDLETAEAAEPLPVDQLEAMLSLDPTPSSADEAARTVELDDERESIIGTDDRTRNYTTSYPASAVVLIQFENSRCTGFMISEDTVATAGHCVHESNGGRFFDINTFVLSPGFDRDTAHFQQCGATELYTVTGWVQQADPRFDIAAIKLDCSVGLDTGWFGLRANAGQNETAIVTGYPGDKPLEQWQAVDQVRRTETPRLYYATDTVGGNSGGPVWNDFQTADGSQGPYAIAVHSNGVSSTTNLNSGTRLTDDYMAFLIDVINAP